MGVKIYSKGNLNSNDYKTLVLRKTSKGYIVNVVRNKPNFPTIQQTNKFTDYLKGLSCETQILEIVKYFISYNRLDFIEDNADIRYYIGNFSLVKSDDKALAIQVPKTEKLSKISNLILNKYMLDREGFLKENSDVKKYILRTTRESSYSLVYDDPKYDKAIKLNLKEGFDDQFLKNFLTERFSCQDGFVMYDWMKHYDNNVISGDLVFNFTPVLREKLEEITDEYNYELNEYKSRQLKLEGF